MSELPVGWVEVEIGDLCELVNGRAFKPQEWCKEGLPIIRIQNLNRPDAAFNFFKGELDPRHFVVTGQLLFAWSGTPGTSFGAHVWNGPSAALNQHIFKIEFDTEQVDKTFFRHAINQKLDELIGSAQGGVGLRHVTKGTFERTQITLPPLVEQKRIAQKLDALLAQVDTLKARIDAVPALLKRFRKGVLASAITGKLTEVTFTATIQLSKVGEITGGITKNAKRGSFELSVPYLRVANVQAGYLDLTEVRDIGVSPSEAQKTALERGDILIVEGNGSLEHIGRAATWHGEINGCCHQNHLIRWRSNGGALPEFVMIYLSSPQGRSDLVKVAKSTTGLHTLSISKVSSLTIPVADLQQQQQIVRRVEQLFAYANQLEAKVTAVKQRIDALTQSLLAKAFRGELVPQDPSDEPASVLLERIRTQRAATPKPKRGRKAATS
ncbi:type I restriction enzyme S subunit [Xanthomonas arboricola]|uniref:restriction endonuclease subunit S n=1 Tax=Xanthomonas sp. 3793 TaxID=3035312 RepID=UPI0021675F95|nr:restriction endonuclease subunit S [Xanthomonas sp. 3793]MCS3745900.1 type I restriction enzyme S subunit [Xanthomonas sp. 3793]